MSNQIFKVGDLVNYYPYGDKVFELVENKSSEYPLRINIDDYACRTFGADGKECEQHAIPMLKLVKRNPENEDWYQVFYKTKRSLLSVNSGSLFKSKEQLLSQLELMGLEESDFEFIVFKKVNMESDL